MSLKLTFPYKDKSAIDDMLRMDEIKDLAERDFKHWGNTPFFILQSSISKKKTAKGISSSSLFPSSPC